MKKAFTEGRKELLGILVQVTLVAGKWGERDPKTAQE